MSPAAAVRIGIVGTGAIASKHLSAISDRPDVLSLGAVFDTNLGAAEAVAALNPRAKVFSDLDELIDSGSVDAAIVSTPHFLHFKQAMRFVKAGIPVLVEKPLVTSIEHLRLLRAAAHANGTLVVAGQMQRFDRTNVLARRWMDADPSRFGDLASFSLRSWQDITEYTEKIGLSHWLLDGRLAGGGVVVSLAVHQLDVLRFLGGADYARVTALGSFGSPFHHGAESTGSVLLEMDNGATGTIFSTYNAPRPFQSESLSIFGDRGGLTREFRAVGNYGGDLLYGSAHGTEVVNFSEPNSSSDFDLVSDLADSSFTNQLVHFAKSVQGIATPINTVDENFNTVACLDAINQSIREGGRQVAVARE